MILNEQAAEIGLAAFCRPDPDLTRRIAAVLIELSFCTLARTDSQAYTRPLVSMEMKRCGLVRTETRKLKSAGLNSRHGIGSDTTFTAETQLLTISGFLVEHVDQQDAERCMDNFLAAACI